jgi:hypothetical protein
MTLWTEKSKWEITLKKVPWALPHTMRTSASAKEMKLMKSEHGGLKEKENELRLRFIKSTCT